MPPSRRSSLTNPPSEPQAATSSHGLTKSAIVTSISRKRARQRRAGYAPAESGEDLKPDQQPPAATSTSEALMKAMARMIRPPQSGCLTNGTHGSTDCGRGVAAKGFHRAGQDRQASCIAIADGYDHLAGLLEIRPTAPQP
jgi:hypothetical protein